MCPGDQFRIQVQQPQQSKLSVLVPEGMGPGDEITVRAPNGQMFKSPIPDGYGPGNTFYMAVPASALQGAQNQMQQQSYYPQQQVAPPTPAQLNAQAGEF